MNRDRGLIHSKAEGFFENIWKEGDFWDFESSPFEKAKYARLLEMLEGRRYPRALEIACGGGAFTRRMASLCDSVVGVDIAPSAIERARRSSAGAGNVEFRVANAMEMDLRAGGPWDLIVISEVIYYFGWLYTFFEVGWFAAQAVDSLRPGGRLLLVSTCGGTQDYLLSRWHVRTYRDLFLNVGCALDSEEVHRGEKNGVAIDALFSLFSKPPGWELPRP